jgi:protein-S-isoprenylcysteine O-methyltransferase Ste14
LARYRSSRSRSDPMTQAMIRLVVRTNVVLLGLFGLGYVAWAERPRGTIFGGGLVLLAIGIWFKTSKRKI